MQLFALWQSEPDRSLPAARRITSYFLCTEKAEPVPKSRLLPLQHGLLIVVVVCAVLAILLVVVRIAVVCAVRTLRILSVLRILIVVI